MNVLKFKMSEVYPIVTHALSAQKHIPTYDQAYDIIDGELVKKENPMVEPGLHFVKDQGAYLISNGVHKKDETPASLGLVAYAEGTNPKLCDDWWEVTREKCGGDDFVEYLPIDWFSEALESGGNHIELRLSENSIEMCVT